MKWLSLFIFASTLSLGLSSQAAPFFRPDSVWTHCANEGEDCFIPDSAVQFRFGSAGRFRETPVGGRFGVAPGTVRCDTGTLGDPNVGADKQCYYLARPTEKVCAREGDECKAMGSIVVFGVDGRYTEPVRLSKSVRCNIKTFGWDPAPGLTKYCIILTQ